MKIDHCAILGGGIAGLTLADRLSERGMKVTLIERAPRLGGLCRAVEVEGGRVDLGPHNLRAADDRVLSYWRELLGAELESRYFPAKIFYSDSLLSYPVRPIEILRRLNLSSIYRSSRDILSEKVRSKVSPRHILSYRDWAISNYGNELYETFFRPLTEKVWGIPPERLDAGFARERLPPLSLTETLLGMVGIKHKGKIHSEDTRAAQHYYPRFGVSSFVEKLSERLKSKNVEILLSTETQQIEEDGSGVTLWIQKNGIEQRRFDVLASSIPLPALSKLYRPITHCSQGELVFRGVGFLYLSVPREDRLPSAFVYCADGEAPFNRLTDFSYCSEAVCYPNRNVICVEFNQDKFVGMSETHLVEKITQFIRRAGLLSLSQVFGAEFEYEKMVYPLYQLGYRNEVRAIFEVLARSNRLLSFGRQGLFAHLNIDQVMLSAFETENLLAEAPFDLNRKRHFYALEDEHEVSRGAVKEQKVGEIISQEA